MSRRSMSAFAAAIVSIAGLAGCGEDDPAENASSGGASGPGASGPGGSPGEGGSGGGSGGSGAQGPFDLGAGTWVIENVSNTPGTISHDGSLALLEDGTPAVAFSEPDSENVTDQDIWVATRQGDAWAGVPLTADFDVQNAFPSLRAYADDLHLVYNGYPDGLNEIYWLRRAGSTWSDPLDLTGGFEASGTRRTDYAPSLAIDAAGHLAVAYVSEPADDAGAATGPSEIRVLLFDQTGPMGTPLTVIPASGDGCFDPRAIFDSDGALHVVADCGPFGGEDLFYATDKSGAWVSEAFGDTGGSDDYSASIALAPDGATVHVAWVSDGTCGADSCRRIMYARIVDGAPTASKEVVDPSVYQGSHPALGVDGFGRPLIAFHVLDARGSADVLSTWSEDDGATFAPPRNLTPDTAGSDEWFPASIVYHPQSGTPQLMFEAILPGSDPVDEEVMRAVFTPD